jgi:hypothetical protein
MKKLIIALLFSLFVTGCTKTEDYLKDMVIKHSNLIDPSSVMFRNITFSDYLGKNWCGEINAKNRMGGYTGWQEFIMSKNENDGTIDFSYKSDMKEYFWDTHKNIRCRGLPT